MRYGYGLGSGQINAECTADAASPKSDPDWQAEKRRAAEEQELNMAFHTLLRADEYRSNKALMERLRVWLRGKRTELDQQLDHIVV